MQRAPRCRPRPIRVHKNLLVVKSVDEFVYEDEEGKVRRISKLDQGSSNGQIVHKDKKPRPTFDIPMPETNLKDSRDKKRTKFKIPASYIRFKKLAAEEEENYVLYDADYSDEIWLKSHPREGTNGSHKLLSTSRFEKLIFALELHEAKKQAKGLKMTTAAEAQALFYEKFSFMSNGCSKLIADLVQYWQHKRHRFKKPLLRKFWPTTSIHDTNPHMVFRPREKERYKLRKHRKNDKDAFKKMQRLWTHHQLAYELFKLVIKRERVKREVLDFQEEFFEQQVYDITDRSGKARKLKVKPRKREHLKLKFRIKAPAHPRPSSSSSSTPRGHDTPRSHGMTPGRQQNHSSAADEKERKRLKKNQRKRKRLESGGSTPRESTADAGPEDAATPSASGRERARSTGRRRARPPSTAGPKQNKQLLLQQQQLLLQQQQQKQQQQKQQQLQQQQRAGNKAPQRKGAVSVSIKTNLEEARPQLTAPAYLFPCHFPGRYSHGPATSYPEFQTWPPTNPEAESPRVAGGHHTARPVANGGGSSRGNQIRRRCNQFGYVCRGRIGRGGRLLIDRLRRPMRKAKTRSWLDRESGNPAVVYARPPTRAAMTTAPSMQAHFTNESSATKTGLHNLSIHVSEDALQKIYGMSDSEDDNILPPAELQARPEQPQKRAKFVLQL